MTRCHILAAVLFNMLLGAWAVCPNGYEEFSDTCYKVSSGLHYSSYGSAEATCKAQGGTLAVISNAFTASFILQLAQKNGVFDYWVGLKCNNAHTSSCKWADGSSVSYNNFYPGNPTLLEHCVMVDRARIANGRWLTKPCLTQLRYACQIKLEKTTPKTTTTTILPTTTETTTTTTTEVTTTSTTTVLSSTSTESVKTTIGPKSCFTCQTPTASYTIGTTNAQIGQTTFTCYTGNDGCPRLNVSCTGYDYALLSEGGYFFPPPPPSPGGLVTAEVTMYCAENGWTPDPKDAGILSDVFSCDVGQSPPGLSGAISNCGSNQATTTTPEPESTTTTTTVIPTTSTETLTTTNEPTTTTTTVATTTSTLPPTTPDAGTPPFSLNSTMVPSAGGCNEGWLKAPGNINSPNFPYNYPPNIKCYYQLQAQQYNQRLSVVFNIVDVEFSDPIYVYDGPSEKYPLLGQFHSKITAPQSFNSTSNQLLVTFSSDADGFNQGFKAKFVQLK